MQDKDFIAYEYKTISVKAKDQSRAADLYEAFGWEVTGMTPTALDNVTISLKRNRKQKHKQELTKLERQAESTLDAINRLKAAKTKTASVFSYIFGSIAALIFGGGMCMTIQIQNSIPALTGGIIIGIFGLVLCSANYFIYKKLAEKKTKQLLPVIDDSEEQLANLLEKGNDLLNTDII